LSSSADALVRTAAKANLSGAMRLPGIFDAASAHQRKVWGAEEFVRAARHDGPVLRDAIPGIVDAGKLHHRKR
jgi:hypothetical protein